MMWGHKLHFLVSDKIWGAMAPPGTTSLVTSKINHNVENVKLKLQHNIYRIGLNQLRYVGISMKMM